MADILDYLPQTSPTPPPVPVAPPPTGSTTQREGYTISTSSLPKGLQAKVDQKSKDFTALSTDLQAQLKANTDQILSNADATKAAIDQSTAAKVAQSGISSDIESAQLKNKTDILSAFGINMNDPNNIVARDVQTIRQAHDQRMDLADQIAQLHADGPPTNPLMWFINSIKSVPLINAHNDLLRKENSASQDLEQAQRDAANQTLLQPAAIQDKINAKKLADANATIAQGELDKQATTGAARAKVAQNIIEMSHLAGQDLTQTIQLAEAQRVHTSTTYSDTSKVSAADNAEQRFLAPINTAIAQFGLTPFQSKLAFDRLDKKTQDTILKWTQFGRPGSSPGETTAALNDILGSTNLRMVSKDAPDVQSFWTSVKNNGMGALSALEQAAIQNPAAREAIKATKNDPNALMALGIDTWAKAKIEEVNKPTLDMSKISRDNPYQLDYNRVATDSRLADNPIAAAITTRPPNTIVNDHLLQSIALADVLNKKKTAPQAAQELADFYRTGVFAQQTNRAMTTMGLPMLTKYPVTAQGPGLFAPTMTIDMMNPQSIENYLTRQVIASPMQQAGAPEASTLLGAGSTTGSPKGANR
jgi:hypothetical protein